MHTTGAPYIIPVQAEEPLETHAGFGFLEPRHLEPLLNLYHLMQAAIPRTHGHFTTRRLVHNNDLAFFDYILLSVQEQKFFFLRFHELQPKIYIFFAFEKKQKSPTAAGLFSNQRNGFYSCSAASTRHSTAPA